MTLKHQSLTLLLSLCGTLLLGACGNKGDLYLVPDELSEQELQSLEQSLNPSVNGTEGDETDDEDEDEDPKNGNNNSGN